MTDLTPELHYLAAYSVLVASLWIPYITLLVRSAGPLAAENYNDPGIPRETTPLVRRLNRVHINAVESFGPFAALVLLVHVTDAYSAMTAIWAAVYFWSRLAHAVVFMAGWPYVRTLTFTVGWIAQCGLFYELVT